MSKLQMYRVNGYNQLSDELAATFPGLGKNDVMIFRHVNTKPDPDNPDKIIAPIHQDVPPISSVWDPYQDKWVPIAAIKGTAIVDRPVPGEPGKTMPVEQVAYFGDEMAIKSAFGGRKICYGNRLEDVRIAEYLFFAGYRADIEDRPSGEKAIYVYEDIKARADKRAGDLKIRRAADDQLDSMLEDAGSIRAFAASMGWGADKGLGHLINKAIDYVEQNPQKFLNQIGDPNLKVKATVSKAFDRGILSFDNITFTVKWAATGDEIMQYPKVKGERAKAEEVTRYILNNRDGSYLLGELQRRMGESEVQEDNTPVLDASKTAIELADKYGIDLSQVEGSGAGGKILKTDVEKLVPAEG